MKTNKLYSMAALVLLAILTACNKGQDNFLYKGDMQPVTITGYNASNELLEAKLDTIPFSARLEPNSIMNVTGAYTFANNQTQIKLLISEKATGKKVLEKEIKKEGRPIIVNFFYMNGQASNMPEKPAVEEGKNKVIYMFRPTVTQYAGPVDIALGRYYNTPKVFEELGRIRNVQPNVFTESVTVPSFSTAAGQQYNGQATAVSFRARIYKAGTDEFYTEGTSYTWNLLSSTAPLPAASSAASKLYVFEENPSGANMLFTKRLEL